MPLIETGKRKPPPEKKVEKPQTIPQIRKPESEKKHIKRDGKKI